MDKKRNVGIDLLRILCMAGFCIIHAVGYGWGGHALTEGNYITSEYTGLHICLLATTTVAVNIYFLMSGYFHSKFRWKKLIEIIVEGSLYSCVGYILACVLGYKEFGFLPLCRRIVTGWMLWFIVVYIIIYCFSNYIIRFLDTLSDAELKKILIIYAILNTVLGFIFNVSSYGSPWSALPMLFVYIIGYAVRRWDYSIKLKSKNINLLVYLVICLGQILIGFILLHFNQQELVYRVITDYRNPFLVISACGLFIYFLKDIKIQRKIISRIAQHVLAVYMLTDGIDVHGFIWNPLKVPVEVGLSWYFVLLYLILYVIIMMIICVFIDCIREAIYRKVEKFVMLKYQKYLCKK